MKYLIGLLIIFEIADGVLTHFLVESGIAREGNPFLAPFVGETSFLVLKVVGVLICALILWDIHKRYPRLAVSATAIFTLGYGVIAFWNLSLLVLA
ncbi:DUF5658 family protein [Chloroflexota bacterium]